jgi:hypothetical protein
LFDVLFDESGDNFKMAAVISYGAILAGAFGLAMGLFFGFRALKLI